MKKILFTLCGLLFLSGGLTAVQAKQPPRVDEVVSPIKKDFVSPDDYGISKDQTLKENIFTVLYPLGMDNYGTLGNLFRSLAVGLVLVYIFYAGMSLVTSSSKSEDLKKELKNLGYISLGALFIYGSGWFFGDVFDVRTITGVEPLVDRANSSFFLQFLTVLKGFAFFYAILMVVIIGFRTIVAWDAAKSKKLVKGILNVVGALTLMKVVDFVYYIASMPDFVQQATDFIISAAKFCGFIYGAIAVIMVFYAGFSFLTDGGSGSGSKRAKTILINLLVSGVVLFSFLLILYQVFAKFGG